MSETEQVGAPGSDDDVDRPSRVSDSGGDDGRRGRSDGQPAEPTAEADESAEEEIRMDVVFDILKNQRRRHVLRYLRENETTTLSDLAEHVAALENDKDVRSLTSSERKRVYVGLYQCHLPRMSDAGVIEFDSDRGRIELLDAAEQLEEYLDAHDGPSPRWHRYQLSLAVGGGAAYAASATFLGPQSAVSVLVVLALVSAVAGCALAERRARSIEDD